VTSHVDTRPAPAPTPRFYQRRHTPGGARALKENLDRILAEISNRQAAAARAQQENVPPEEVIVPVGAVEPPAFIDTGEPLTPAPPATPALDKALEILKSIFGIGAEETQPVWQTPSSGMIRTQASRGRPMSLLGNITSLAGMYMQSRAAKNMAQQVAPMSFSSLVGPPPGDVLARRALATLPSSVRPGVGTLAPISRASIPSRLRITSSGSIVTAGKRRRQNPINVHALRRALRRVEGFVKIEKRVDKILRRVAPKARVARKVGFVKSRRR
jgi:hypothetical protein